MLGVMDKKEELQAMSLERRLASLNITRTVVPVPPPRMKRMQKRVASLPDKMTVLAHGKPELYGEKAHSFDSTMSSEREEFSFNEHQDYNGHTKSPVTSPTKPSYSKYEVLRKDVDSDSYTPYSQHSTCDIIQSSQRTFNKPQLRRPDILRGSFNADLRSKLLNEESTQAGNIMNSKMSSKDKGRSQPQRSPTATNLDANKNLITAKNRSRSQNTDKHLMSSRSDLDGSHKHEKTSDHKNNSKSTGSPTKTTSNSHGRFMFYKPRTDKLTRQSHAGGPVLSGIGEVCYNGGSLLPSPEGSFVNPAFDIVDNTQSATPIDSPPNSPEGHSTPVLSSTPLKTKPVPLSNRPVYSTMGSSFSMRPCTPSPPSHRFRNSKPPIPEPEPKSKISLPNKPLGPSPLKPLISAKHLENSLKQYSSQSKLDTSDLCPSQALENMMKYYNMSNEDSLSSSPTPPSSRLSSSKKDGSPYSSSSSLNVSGDSIDIVLRRKKKIRIRPPSVSSDDESVKRVSLEINLASSGDSRDTAADSTAANRTDANKDFNDWKGSSRSLSRSQTSLNQTVEKLELDDLTSTETAKLLRKQFAKLKVKANNLKVKDNELKQRFVLLQNQRGRVCGHGGSVTKSKIRSSPVLL